MRLKIKSIQKILFFTFALFLVLDLNSVYTRLTTNAIPTTEICVILSILILCVSFLVDSRLDYKIVFFIFAYLAYLIVFLIFTPKTGLTGFIIKFGVMLPSLCLVFYKKTDNILLLLKYFAEIIIMLALISLLFYPFTNVLQILNPMGELTVHWRGDAPFHNYLFLFFTNDYSNYTNYLIRNTGIFVEAPQYGLNLIFALVYELCIREKIKKINILIIAVTIVTTISVGSIITMLIMFFAKFIMFPVKNQTLRRIKHTVSIVFFCIVTSSLVYLLDVKMGSGNSFKIRVDDFVSGFASWKLHPWFGNGYGNSEVIKQFVGEFRSWSVRNGVVGFSNSIAMVLSNGGILLFLVYAGAAFSFLKSNFINIWNRLLIVAVILLMLIFNSFAYSSVVFVFLAIGYSLGLDKHGLSKEKVTYTM